MNRDRTILEERVIPEEEHVLTSKRYKTTDTGTLKEIRVAFCSWCRRRLSQSERTVICCTCHRVLCDSPSCAIMYEGRHYCRDDLQRILPMDKLQFMLIHGLVEGLDLDKIREMSRSEKQGFRSALDRARANRLIERKGISLFAYDCVSDYGILCWKTHYPAFSQDGEVSFFMEEIERHLEEVNENERKRYSGKSS